MAELHDTVHIKGLAALGRVLEQLPTVVKEKVATKATFAGVKVMRDAVVSEAPVGGGERSPKDPHPGLLQRSIKYARRRKGLGEYQVQYVVYVDTKRSKGKMNQATPYYWYFIEFGTIKMAANPFMLRGFQKSVAEAGAKFRDEAARLTVASIVKG